MKKETIKLYKMLEEGLKKDGSILKAINNYINEGINKEIKLEILNNRFDDILEYLNNSEISKYLNLIYENIDTREFLITKSNEIIMGIIVLRRLNSKATSVNLNSYLMILHNLGYTIKEILNILNPFMDKIGKILEYTIHTLNEENYTNEEKQFFKDYIDKMFEENPSIYAHNIVLSSLVSRSYHVSLKYCSDIDDIYVEFFKELILDLMKNENVKYSDIKLLNRGYFSDVYQIGEKVLKLGISKQTKQVPNSKYIIQPLIRFNLQNIFDEVFLYVEVEEKVDTIDNITNEDVYQLYKNLRSEGIKWLDPKTENIGRLKKKNKSYIYNEEVSVDQVVNGFHNNNEQILEEGSLVVTDIDYLYLDTDEIDIEYDLSLENRWNKENSR